MSLTSLTGKIEDFRIRRSIQQLAHRAANDSPELSEITLTPKASSDSVAEGTIFYCSSDDHVYVGTE